MGGTSYPTLRLGLVAAVFLCGCKKLPDAPTELEELAVYLFQHLMDEDDDHLQAGIQNLGAWLSANYAEANEGYRVDDLSQEAVEGLESQTPDLDEQVGAAVAYDMGHSVDDVVEASLLVDPMDMNPDLYENFERDWIYGEDCYFEHECDISEALTSSTTVYPFNIKVSATNLNQYRWVETDLGVAHIRRNWMVEPAETSVNWIELDQQYFVAALIPINGGTRRLDAGWVIARMLNAPIPEDMGVRIAVDSMKASGEATEEWLDNH